MFVMHTEKRILIADDSKTMTNIIFRILKDANYADIDVVHDAGSALAALHRKEYNLVITDCQMQPISWPELTKLIRADARLSKVRIILVTGLMTQTTCCSMGQMATSRSHLSRKPLRKK
jgi:PleD family two-component response regulator